MNWKRSLMESFVAGTLLTLIVIFVARQQVHTVLEWIGPVFYVPFHGAAMLSGNADEPPPWLFHTILLLQFILAVYVAGWLVGRYRRRASDK